jgi:molecular chaperone GrpE
MSEELNKDNMENQVGEASEAQPEMGQSDETPEGNCEQLLQRKNEELRQLQDRLLRLAAESENARKRLEREKAEGIAFANESILRSLLAVGDSLDLAIQHSEGDVDPQALLEGIRMTRKVFLDVLARYGCVPFDSQGKEFDPNFHEAMLQQESEEFPENTIAHEYQKGYMLNDRLLRPAMVVVSKGLKSG